MASIRPAIYDAPSYFSSRYAAGSTRSAMWSLNSTSSRPACQQPAELRRERERVRLVDIAEVEFHLAEEHDHLFDDLGYQTGISITVRVAGAFVEGSVDEGNSSIPSQRASGHSSTTSTGTSPDSRSDRRRGDRSIIHEAYPEPLGLSVL